MDANLTRFASDDYAKTVEHHPYHRLLNTPALLSVMPTLKGLRVLDAGCGTGWFTEYFVTQGAVVTGLDISAEMVERTRARVPEATVIQANLAEPLRLEEASFDLVRILKPGGLFIFSSHHPFEEFKLSGENYFVTEERKRKRGTVSFRRPLSVMTEALQQAGFVIERLLEPLPKPAYAETDPEGYEGLLKFPGLLVIRARKSPALL
jgi:SAM-dependent methyltransferase